MTIRIPAEWEPHACCWMAWAVDPETIKSEAVKIKRDLSLVVKTIARYEPVRLLARRGHALHEARKRFAACANVAVIEAPVYDFWLRDIMPTFAIRDANGRRQIIAIDWNFRGWGDKSDRWARAGDHLPRTAHSIFSPAPRMAASFVAEGGALITDGLGTMITTRSCLLNPNRNAVRRGIDWQQKIEADLTRFGISRVIWLEGDPCEPLTSGHIDGYVLCAPRGTVLIETVDDNEVEPPMWRNHDVELLSSARNAEDRKLKVVRVLSPRKSYWKSASECFAAAYLNAYIANGAVVTARFGDPERDEAARRALAQAFPGRDVVALRIDAIAKSGGGVHCLTQPMPAVT
jgi:agmatine deiminase